jgi:hypothetical protein
MATNKKVIEVEIAGKKTELAVVRPNAKQRQEGLKYYNKAFREALESGAILRPKIESVMREQKLWDDNKENSLRQLQNKIAENEKKLKSGGIKLSEAREIAISLRKQRAEIRTLTSEKINLDNNSAEAQADNAQFNYYVSACTVYGDNGKPYFKSYDEYMSKDDDPVVAKAASAMAQIIYNLEEDYDKKLPENEFLVKFKFADQSLHLINKQGKKIDSEGRLVDDEGRYIDENGNYIDINGDKIDKEGNYIVEHTPFLDEDGKPLIEDENPVIQKEEKTLIEEKKESQEDKPV